jgi:hypothetical protein
MKIRSGEQEAIRTVIDLAESYGYGNLMQHLASAWACRMIDEGCPKATAIDFVSGRGPHPSLAMHKDIVENGEWDETGMRYQDP